MLGGGPIGCELGQAFARLGSSVTIVEAAERLIPGETPAAADILARTFRDDGIDVRTGVKLTSVDAVRDGRRVALLDDGSEVEVEVILVAVGRSPRTSSLGLAAAGVAVTDSGHIEVDERLRTSNPRIWAAGDLTGYAPFTHTAGNHGSLAASNAVLGLRRTVQPDVIPRVTYTSPEVASFGVAADSRPGLRVHTVPHSEVDRAVAEGRTRGYSQLVLDQKGRVAGARADDGGADESLRPCCPASPWPRRCSPGSRASRAARWLARSTPTRRGPTASGRPPWPRVGPTSRPPRPSRSPRRSPARGGGGSRADPGAARPDGRQPVGGLGRRERSSPTTVRSTSAPIAIRNGGEVGSAPYAPTAT